VKLDIEPVNVRLRRLQAQIEGKHSPHVRWVTGADCVQVGAGIGGLHGLPVMALRRTSMTLQPCLRAVSM
jgi:hypothetical protein